MLHRASTEPAGSIPEKPVAPGPLTVADLVVRFIEILGVRHVFGIPGAHILPVYDSLFHSSIQPILAKHEQGAAFMAGGYAKAAGGVGVCVATAGPGATNLVTGLANAYADRTPVLAITGETPTYSFGKGALQESSGQGSSINQSKLFQGITRYTRIVERTDYLEQVLRKTYGILMSPNPGPVLLSFPYNVLKETPATDGEFLYDLASAAPFLSRPTDTAAADRIPDFLAEARHPVLIAGHGAIGSGAVEEIRRLSTNLSMPVATSLKARGILPETSELSLGVMGVTSPELARRYIEDEADLLILAGVSFGERTSYNWADSLTQGKKIIRIDADPDQFTRPVTPDLAVFGDLHAVLKRVNHILDEKPLLPREVFSLQRYRALYPDPNIREEDFYLIKEFLTRAMRVFGSESMIFDDNILYLQNFVRIERPGSYIPNSGISSLGQALPAAIGASIAARRPTVAVLGDGGFQMCAMEIMTAVNHAVPLTVILLNNESLGLVRKNQHHNYGGRHISCDFVNPDYGLLARSFGISYRRVEDESGIGPALENLDPRRGIHLIEVLLNKDRYPSYSSGR